LAEPSSSIVARSEHQFNRQTRQRLSLRKHLYERLDGTGGEKNLECGQFDANGVEEELGEYLGFLDLRLNSEQSPLGLGLLAPPKRYRRDPDTFLVTGAYGPVFGSPAFRATVYSQHDPNTSGAVCAQACLIMALGSLSDRRARLEGLHTLTVLAADYSTPNTNPGSRIPVRRPINQLPGVMDGTQCRNALPDRNQPGEFFRVGGLIPGQCRHVLMHCGVNSFLHTFFHPPRPAVNRLIERYLEAYLYSRFPVIYFVDTLAWWPWESGKEDGHAVVVIGLRRERATRKCWLITHDPGFRPFFEKPLGKALDAGWRFSEKKRREAGKQPLPLRFLAVVDAKLRIGADACVDYLRNHPVYSRVFVPYLETLDTRDYQIRLCERSEIFSRLCDLMPGLTPATRDALATLPNGRYWCVFAFSSQDTLHELRHLWIFDAEQSLGVGTAPVVYLARPRNGPERFDPLHNRGWPTLLPNQPPPARPKARKSELAQTLQPSIITSSSIRDLRDLFGEIWSVSQVALIDLFVLRDTDVSNLERQTGVSLHPSLPPQVSPLFDNRDIAELMANRANFNPIRDWVVRQFAPPVKVKVSALASYFPGIVSCYEQVRDMAVGALTNTALLALALQEQKLMDQPIIEFVCGSLLDPCACVRCQGLQHGATCYISSQNLKLELLIDSLNRVVQAVQQQFPGRRFFLAAELEPGPTYVVRDEDSLRLFLEAVKRDASLHAHVGLNLDVAHMRIAGVRPEFLGGYSSRILHSHICDHPGMHTRDQQVGSWTFIDRRSGEFNRYLRLLVKRMNTPMEEEALPYSGACALELEGCNRIAWIHHSVVMMRHLFATAQNWE